MSDKDASWEKRVQPNWQKFEQQFAMDSVFVVADACQAYEFVCQLRFQYHLKPEMLFEGVAVQQHEIEEVAPYVCAIVPPQPTLTRWIEMIGSNSGILFSSKQSVKAVYRHLRGLFVSEDEIGQQYFFRFYDPRVIRGFLPACQPEEVIRFFGPLECVVVESALEDHVTAYTHSEGRLAMQVFNIR